MHLCILLRVSAFMFLYLCIELFCFSAFPFLSAPLPSSSDFLPLAIQSKSHSNCHFHFLLYSGSIFRLLRRINPNTTMAEWWCEESTESIKRDLMVYIYFNNRIERSWIHRAGWRSWISLHANRFSRDGVARAGTSALLTIVQKFCGSPRFLGLRKSYINRRRDFLLLFFKQFSSESFECLWIPSPPKKGNLAFAHSWIREDSKRRPCKCALRSSRFTEMRSGSVTEISRSGELAAANTI